MCLDELYEEMWLSIPEYPEYEISSIGRIRKGNKILKPFVNYGHGSRYLRIKLSNAHCCRAYYVHRLVAMTFLEKPDGAEFVNHKNCDTFNNSMNNLEWCTHSQNVNWSNTYEPAF